MGTKNDPGAYDCYDKAEPDEPLFVLLARDPAAPGLVEAWAAERLLLIEDGTKPEADQPMIEEALRCAAAMRSWRDAKR